MLVWDRFRACQKLFQKYITNLYDGHLSCFFIKNVDQYQINPPSSKRVRLERLYDLARIVLVDNIADDAEKKLMYRLVIGLGFEADQANSIVEKSFIEIQKGCHEDEFISSF